MSYTIIIGNKNYSSWSMRPWLVLEHFGLPFDEIMIPLDTPETRASILNHSPAGKVPILLDGSFAVWDSMAIIEYLAEKHPDLGIWPADPKMRARARAVALEMHAGFGPMRQALPMNLKMPTGRQERRHCLQAGSKKKEGTRRDTGQTEQRGSLAPKSGLATSPRDMA